MISSLNLVQNNVITNTMNRTPDLVLVNNSDNFEVTCVYPLSLHEDSYHPAICIRFYLQAKNSVLTHSSRKIFCFSRAKFFLLNSLLESVDWEPLLQCES